MSMKLTLSPNLSFGLAAVLFSVAINAATQEAPDPSRIAQADAAAQNQPFVHVPFAHPGTCL
jgi:hypothetical protein